MTRLNWNRTNPYGKLGRTPQYHNALESMEAETKRLKKKYSPKKKRPPKQYYLFGDTYGIKDQLKEWKFRWDSKKKAWHTTNKITFLRGFVHLNQDYLTEAKEIIQDLWEVKAPEEG